MLPSLYACKELLAYQSECRHGCHHRKYSTPRSIPRTSVTLTHTHTLYCAPLVIYLFPHHSFQLLVLKPRSFQRTLLPRIHSLSVMRSHCEPPTTLSAVTYFAQSCVDTMRARLGLFPSHSLIFPLASSRTVVLPHGTLPVDLNRSTRDIRTLVVYASGIHH